MFIELVDHLRCVRPHEDSWLVAAARRMEGRRIVEGTLGCPVCRAEYPIRGGIADFRGGAGPEREPAGVQPPAVEEGQVIRAGALLGLTDAGGAVLLTGAWGAVAHALAELVDAQFLLLDPPPGVRAGEGISIVRSGDGGAAPFGADFLRAAAVDDAAAATGSLAHAAALALRAGGRLLAPVATPLPAGIRELARDDRQWVGEREAGISKPVRLGLARR